MALVIPPYHSPREDFYYHPWRVHHEVIPRSHKTWQDDFGYILHPLRNIERSLEHTSDVPPAVGKDGFKVCVDVHQFMPGEISLKTTHRYIVIEGKHEEREDEHGYIMRQFARRYELPEGYDTKHVTSEMSSDGILTIRAPKPIPLESNERQIPIQHTGPAHLVHAAYQPTIDSNRVPEFQTVQLKKKK